jgi:hypothetical protein
LSVSRHPSFAIPAYERIPPTSPQIVPGQFREEGAPGMLAAEAAAGQRGRAALKARILLRIMAM